MLILSACFISFLVAGSVCGLCRCGLGAGAFDGCGGVGIVNGCGRFGWGVGLWVDVGGGGRIGC